MAKAHKIQRSWKRSKGRSFLGAASGGDYYADWYSNNLTVDEMLRGSLSTIRGRSRDLVLNNPYAKKFVKMCKANIAGQKGVTMQAKVTAIGSSPNNPRMDPLANYLIEREWQKWTHRKNCSANQKMNWAETQKLIIGQIAQDGEVFVRLIRNRDVNPYAFSTQVIEADLVDESYNRVAENQNDVINGIEYDEYERPVAYYMYERHPGHFGVSGSGQGRRIRIPAYEIIHIYDPEERASQNRGLPWLCPVMKNLQQLGGYEEAELISSRVAATKLLFISLSEGNEWDGGEDVQSEYDNLIRNIEVAEPGSSHLLPPGSTVSSFDANKPGDQYAPFVKSQLRSIASGAGVSYNALANDLEGVNFSSIRHGASDERELWKMKQEWFIDWFIRPVYETWLEQAILSGQLALDIGMMDRYLNVNFSPRSWDYVDPQKEANAHKTELELGITSRSAIARSKGCDFEEILKERQREEQLAADMGVSLNGLTAAVIEAEGSQGDTAEDDAEASDDTEDD